MAGDIDLLLNLWDFSLDENYKFPEEAVTKSYFKNFEKLKNNHSIYKDLNQDNDIYWIKNNLYLSSYKNLTCYRGCLD
jgi:hypothetical protein